MINSAKSALLLLCYMSCYAKAGERASELVSKMKEYTSSEAAKKMDREEVFVKEEDSPSFNVFPKYYAHACEQIAQEIPGYSESVYNELEYTQNTFKKLRQVGKGVFSQVYEGINTLNDEKVAIKVLKPAKEKKIRREAKILEAVKGGPNIIELIAVVKDPETEHPAFVMEFIDTTDISLRKIKFKFNAEDVRYYMYQLLKALDYANSKGIMHRDVKPANIAIDHANYKLYLLDWGTSEFYHPGQQFNP